MNTAVFVSPKIRKVVQRIEWLLLAHSLFATVSSVAFENTLTAWIQLTLFLAAFGVLSFFLPVQRPLWQRRCYIAAELLILILPGTLPINNFLFFELITLKACFLLPRRDVIVAMFVTVSILVAQITLELPLLIEKSRINSAEYFSRPRQIIVDIVIEHLIGSTFVVLFGIIFAAEQRSRHRAEVLSKEVEALATKLERTRIARDIHDSLGHSLTTLDVQLALAQRYNQLERSSTAQPSAHQEKLQQSLDTAQQLTTQCLTEARQSLSTMRESSFSLEEALSTLAEQMRQSFSVNLQVAVRWPGHSSGVSLPQQLSYQLYLIAKEGFVNIQKHAKASRASLSVVSTDDLLTMTLTDDGCGFDPDKPVSGYGLQGIRERSHLLGGQLTISTLPQQGTTLQITIPLPQAPKSLKARLFTLSTQLV